MGLAAQKISTVDREVLIEDLNCAFSEEWLSYYQYWIGAQVAKGPMRIAITEEFMEHAKQELHHATLISTRIIQLGGTPIINHEDWEKVAKCKYEAPRDEKIMAIVKQNLESERCAIMRYQNICEFTKGKDIETFHMARSILSDEIDHEQDMEDYLEDFEVIFNKKCKDC